jgi:hypothetical protein
MRRAPGLDITAKETLMSNFENLDPSSLNVVTGGKTVTGSSASGSSSSNSALTTQLAGLQSSIKDLATQPQQQSAFGNPTNLLLFAMLASRPQPSQTNVVYVRRGCW